ncbi:hypothetical protein D3C87_1862800 [compost metagenome]
MNAFEAVAVTEANNAASVSTKTLRSSSPSTAAIRTSLGWPVSLRAVQKIHLEHGEKMKRPLAFSMGGLLMPSPMRDTWMV